MSRFLSTRDEVIIVRDGDVPTDRNSVLSATTTFHLPGKHEQKKHGNRTGKSTDSSAERSMDQSTDKSFSERVQSARTGRSVLTAAQGTNPDDVSLATANYARRGHKDINYGLRTALGDVDELPDSNPRRPRDYDRDEVRAEVAKIDAVMRDSTLTSDVVVYRGIRDPERVFGSDVWESGDVTDLEFRDDGFTSTSVDRSMSEEFSFGSRGTVMRILVPKGTHALAIEADSGDFGDESELLLDRSLNYRVVNDTTSDGVRTLDVEVV